MDQKVERAALVATLSVTAIAFLVGLLWYRRLIDPVTRGKDINRKACELSFLERGVPVPASAPREGYWGVRLGAKIPHPNLGWHEPSLSLPGLLEIDSRGFQRYTSSARNKFTVILLGGSVAFGGYASDISTTYFHVLGAELERHLIPSDLTIVASGAWKSIQELIALQLYGHLLRPNLVIFLNGLNDLTNGATSRTLYNQAVETAIVPSGRLSITHTTTTREQKIILRTCGRLPILRLP